MSDFIKREDAISKIYSDFEVDSVSSARTFAFIANIIDSLSEMPAADVVERPRWIPVTERLPEMYQPVLTFDGEFQAVEMRVPYILDDDGNQIKSDWWVDADNDINAEYYKGLRDGAASYWMPLPEPPKEEA